MDTRETGSKRTSRSQSQIQLEILTKDLACGREGSQGMKEQEEEEEEEGRKEGRKEEEEESLGDARVVPVFCFVAIFPR